MLGEKLTIIALSKKSVKIDGNSIRVKLNKPAIELISKNYDVGSQLFANIVNFEEKIYKYPYYPAVLSKNEDVWEFSFECSDDASSYISKALPVNTNMVVLYLISKNHISIEIQKIGASKGGFGKNVPPFELYKPQNNDGSSLSLDRYLE